MRRVPAPRLPIIGATTSARATLTAGGAAASGTLSRPHRSGHSCPTRSASTTWPATYFNGCRIAIMTTTTQRPETVRRGPAQIAVPLSFAAVLGTTFLRTSARPTAEGTPPASGAPSSASVSGGRLPLKPFPFYLLGPGQETRAPCANISFVTVAGGTNVAV
jgi:hypothetical protein